MNLKSTERIMIGVLIIGVELTVLICVYRLRVPNQPTVSLPALVLVNCQLAAWAVWNDRVFTHHGVIYIMTYSIVAVLELAVLFYIIVLGAPRQPEFEIVSIYLATVFMVNCLVTMAFKVRVGASTNARLRADLKANLAATPQLEQKANEQCRIEGDGGELMEGSGFGHYGRIAGVAVLTAFCMLFALRPASFGTKETVRFTVVHYLFIGLIVAGLRTLFFNAREEGTFRSTRKAMLFVATVAMVLWAMITEMRLFWH